MGKIEKALKDLSNAVNSNTYISKITVTITLKKDKSNKTTKQDNK